MVFSYIGYQSQEVLIKNQSKVNIVLKEDVTNAIDEVGITGTGAQTKLTQTGAITTVNVDHLKANPSSSIVNLSLIHIWTENYSGGSWVH